MGKPLQVKPGDLLRFLCSKKKKAHGGLSENFKGDFQELVEAEGFRKS